MSPVLAAEHPYGRWMGDGLPYQTGATRRLRARIEAADRRQSRGRQDRAAVRRARGLLPGAWVDRAAAIDDQGMMEHGAAPPHLQAFGAWVEDRLEFGGGGGSASDWSPLLALRDARNAGREEACGLVTLLLRHVASRKTSAAPMVCGLRNCQECGPRSRLHARDRVVAGPAGASPAARAATWTVMLTLTSSRDQWGPDGRLWDRDPVAVARQVGKWIGTFLKKLLRVWNERAGRERDDRGEFSQYAWVVEAHPDDDRWVHAHVAMSVDAPRMKRGEFLRFRQWLSYAWDEVTGAVSRKYPRSRKKKRVGSWGIFKPGWGPGRSRVHWGPSKKPGRWTGGYLVKYLSKGKYSRWLLAVMYRRRLVGSTLRLEPKVRQWECCAWTYRDEVAEAWVRGLSRKAEETEVTVTEDEWEALDWLSRVHAEEAERERRRQERRGVHERGRATGEEFRE